MGSPPLFPCLLAGALLAGCAGGSDEPAGAAAPVAAADEEDGLWIGPVRLCRDTVETASPAFDVAGSRALLVRLRPEAARQFARWTAGHVGEKLAIRLDGRILSEPVVNEPILGGTAQISGPFEDVDAAARAAKRPC